MATDHTFPITKYTNIKTNAVIFSNSMALKFNQNFGILRVQNEGIEVERVVFTKGSPILKIRQEALLVLKNAEFDGFRVRFAAPDVRSRFSEIVSKFITISDENNVNRQENRSKSNPVVQSSIGKWPCVFCGLSAASASIQCSRCRKWVHRKQICSNLSLRDRYDRETYRCRGCSRPASALPPPEQPAVHDVYAEARHNMEPFSQSSYEPESSGLSAFSMSQKTTDSRLDDVFSQPFSQQELPFSQSSRFSEPVIRPEKPVSEAPFYFTQPANVPEAVLEISKVETTEIGCQTDGFMEVMRRNPLDQVEYLRKLLANPKFIESVIAMKTQLEDMPIESLHFQKKLFKDDLQVENFEFQLQELDTKPLLQEPSKVNEKKASIQKKPSIGKRPSSTPTRRNEKRHAKEGINYKEPSIYQKFNL
ncbi:unnamed protein product [Caenorhabditis auriculariae]|uniref:Zinc finger PHD-type domain-containing protein n=1 Tax=Caenorhabditis auriculariae TaxID=2777116 RepID=A0A8S1HNY6_9PELO|nr:unnamed protein product [Caenorhabditis auriculariae]